MTHERRRQPRYRLDTEIAVDNGRGRTVDISPSSVYFETGTRYRPGDEIALVLPLEQIGPGANVECRGCVVRVEARGPLFGVAATYEPTAFNVRP